MSRKEDNAWAWKMSAKIKEKFHATAERNRHKIPYIATDGVYDDWSGDCIDWWTNGFWGGILWQLYQTTHDPMYRNIARENEKKLDAVLLNYESMDHDSGFRWLPTAVADYRVTGSQEARNRGLLAATNLAGRFNLNGQYLRAWNGIGEDGHQKMGMAIIDCLMNLPLLYWASEETGDPRFRQIAEAHAHTAMKHFVREDGSVKHIICFDPVTGAYKGSVGGQGMERGSSWTRGQSWALYGFVLSYRHTGREEYLDIAEKIAEYCISQIPESGLIPVDFCQPKDVDYQDDIAAAVLACGFLELGQITESWKKERYHETAMKLLHTLAEKSSDWDPEHDNILQNCTAAYHDARHNFPIVYGDYYFIEAIFKLTGEELFIW